MSANSFVFTTLKGLLSVIYELLLIRSSMSPYVKLNVGNVCNSSISVILIHSFFCVNLNDNFYLRCSSD